MAGRGCIVPDDPIADMLDAASQAEESDLPRYRSIVRRAAEQIEPVFFRPAYGDFFWHCATTIPGWLPRVVVACAQTENSGSVGLMELSERAAFEPRAKAGLLRHAKDEARHSFMFVDLAASVFGECYPEGYLDTLRGGLLKLEAISTDNNAPAAMEERMLLDYLIQLNIVEARTRLHLSFLAPSYYSLARTNNKRHVERLLGVLFKDEGKHIGYTAKLIEEMTGPEDVERVAGIYACRLADYNQHTIDHCDSAKNDYGQGHFPGLFDS